MLSAAVVVVDFYDVAMRAVNLDSNSRSVVAVVVVVVVAFFCIC